MRFSISARFGPAIRSLACAFLFACGLTAAERLPAEVPGKCVFDLPEGAAEKTLKAFSEQSGRSLIVASRVTAGVRTKEVQGEFSPRAALERMLAGTGLIAIEDPKNGAFGVRREKEGGPRAPQNSDNPVNGSNR